MREKDGSRGRAEKAKREPKKEKRKNARRQHTNRNKKTPVREIVRTLKDATFVATG